MKAIIKNTIAIGLFIATIHQTSFGQQIVLNSQYMINEFALNPAAAGTKTYAPLVLSVRRQWTGIKEAPVSQHLSYHTSIAPKVGVGGHIFNDVAGPSRRAGVLGAISTQVKVQENAVLSLGLAGSLSQYYFDRDKLITETPNDNTVINYTTNMMIPDMSVGMKLYGKNYHVGLSLFNIIQTKADLVDLLTPVTSNLNRAVYITGMCQIPLTKNNDWIIEPSAMVRLMFNAPLQFDLNARVGHQSGFWFGASYRFKESIIGMIGYGTGILGIGYSYDFSTSAISGFNSGSHEVTLIYRMRNKKSGKLLGGSGKFRVIQCPAF
jgi:type IX secretion system PorP/SprF family membrane protein